MSLLIAPLIGALAGAHTSTWGMYKDSIHEGFTYLKYSRSIVVAACLAIFAYLLIGLELATAGDAVVFFGVVYALERLALELWKGFIREEDQSKYFIPMQFGILGKPVESRAVRWFVLALILAVLAGAAWSVHVLQRRAPDLPPWLVLLTVGSLGGWLTAFGGAWKDAPVEGFETLKFFRSPAISLSWGVVVALFTSDWVWIALAGAGYSVASIETYKTFFFPNKPRGKFAGKPILYPEMLERRKPYAVLYALIWVLILGTLTVALLGPRQGLI